MKKGFSILLILLLIAGCIERGNTPTEINESKLDPGLAGKVEKQEWVGVAVRINSPPREEYDFEEWMAENDRIRREVIADLEPDEFRLTSYSNTRSSTKRHFIGDVTKKGLIKLSNDNRVREIEVYPLMGGTHE